MSGIVADDWTTLDYNYFAFPSEESLVLIFRLYFSVHDDAYSTATFCFLNPKQCSAEIPATTHKPNQIFKLIRRKTNDNININRD